MKTLSVICALIILTASCGRPAKEVPSPDTQETIIEKKDVLAKHQAFDHFSKADLYERAGDLEKAADEYRLALVYDPGSDELKRMLAKLYYRLGRYDEALDLNLRIKNPGPDDLVLTADCYKLTGDEKMAVEFFNEATQMDSTLEIPNHYLAVYYSNKGDLKKAERYYRRLIDISEDSDNWRIELASFYIKTGQFKKATDVYQGMIDRDSSDIRGYLGIAAVKEVQKDTVGADSLYKIIALANWDNAQILTVISQSFIRLGDISMALEVTRRITEIFPDDYLTLRRYALLLFSEGHFDSADSVLWQLSESAANNDPIIYYYRARIAQMTDNFTRAESMYVRSLAIDDTLSEAWVNLALVRAEISDIDNAQATFDTALTKCPDDSLDILFFNGLFLSHQEKYLQAVDYYKRILPVEPENTSVIFNLAAAYERGGQFDEAETLFKRLIKLEPDNSLALNYLGYMYADRGINLKEAQKMIKKALKIEPDNGAYLDSYAWVLYKKGKYKEALAYQQKALQVSDADAVLFDHMGDIYSALNQLSEAQENWRKALELDPKNESIKQKLAR